MLPGLSKYFSISKVSENCKYHTKYADYFSYMLACIELFSVLPPTTLAEILAPSSLMVNRKFELSVDEWKFVGHPFFVQNGVFSITFNVVFVLEVSMNTSTPGTHFCC